MCEFVSSVDTGFLLSVGAFATVNMIKYLHALECKFVTLFTASPSRSASLPAGLGDHASSGAHQPGTAATTDVIQLARQGHHRRDV